MLLFFVSILWGSRFLPVESNEVIYVVQKGDTLTRIANRYGTTVSAICALNGISNPNNIRIGQRLRIPSGPSPTPTPPTPTPPTPTPPTPTPGGEIVTTAKMQAFGWVDTSPGRMTDLNNCLRTFDITTQLRIWHFMGQVAHESAFGKWTVELASGQAYEGRASLGNTQPGDGPRFKGAGYLQMTGRYNYQKFANYVGDQNVMQGVQYVARNYAWKSAGFWWHNNKMNALCDTNPNVDVISKKVNGGLKGAAERRQKFEKAKRVF
ncbi:putative Membrane-bound lytic murein transglycosylase D precursor [Blattamonas nauphoetae]|uniref:Membrane-bound lytic murein transglycosylase D n=1 Tax=Blattamonas nauphoetae TaxID=2049346 RepID=A0ABQ9XU65_9EUKA|nr:putative Membrane-bound lytic murein transglycosylase D precursor [Blattamonas nauphoetae]